MDPLSQPLLVCFCCILSMFFILKCSDCDRLMWFSHNCITLTLYLQPDSSSSPLPDISSDSERCRSYSTAVPPNSSPYPQLLGKSPRISLFKRQSSIKSGHSSRTSISAKPPHGLTSPAAIAAGGGERPRRRAPPSDLIPLDPSIPQELYEEAVSFLWREVELLGVRVQGVEDVELFVKTKGEKGGM
jgi:hypothetical protein